MKKGDINYVKLSANRFENMISFQSSLLTALHDKDKELTDLQDAVEEFVDDMCKKAARDNNYGGFVCLEVDEIVNRLGDLVGYIRDKDEEEAIRQATKKKQAKDKADRLEKEAEEIRKDAEE